MGLATGQYWVKSYCHNWLDGVVCLSEGTVPERGLLAFSKDCRVWNCKFRTMILFY